MAMDERDMPPWLLQAMQEASALLQQVAPYLPMLQDAQRHADEIRRVQPLIQAAQQYAEEIRAARAALEPALRGLELAQVMRAGLYELLWPPRQQRDVFIAVSAATAGATAPPPSVVMSDADALTVRKATHGEVGMPLDAKTVFLVVLWVCTILLPLKVGLLPPEVQTIIWEYVAIVSLTLTVHWRVSDGRNRKRD